MIAPLMQYTILGLVGVYALLRCGHELRRALRR